LGEQNCTFDFCGACGWYRQAMIENPRLGTLEEAVTETARLGFLEKVLMDNVRVVERVNFARGFASKGSIKQNQS
jgi:hypothetical protein